MRGVNERELDLGATRRVGEVLGAAGVADVVDASLIDAATPGDEILTSNPADLAALACAARKNLSVIAVSA